MKSSLIVISSIFGLVGAYIPSWFGDTDLLSGWSILGGAFGGLMGIVIGVWAYKRFI